VCEHVRKVLKRRPRRANDAGDAADDHEPDPDLDSYDPRLFIGQPLLLAATAVLCGAVFGAAWPTLLGGTKGRPAVFMATGVLALVVVMNIISAVAAWRAIRRIFDPGRRRMLMYVAAAGGLAGLLYVRLRVGPMLDASSRKAIRRIVALQAAAAVIGFVFIR
jgi:hypothetical protein